MSITIVKTVTWLLLRRAGAERLIVDAASELASRGHLVRSPSFEAAVSVP